MHQFIYSYFERCCIECILWFLIIRDDNLCAFLYAVFAEWPCANILCLGVDVTEMMAW